MAKFITRTTQVSLPSPLDLIENKVLQKAESLLAEGSSGVCLELASGDDVTLAGIAQGPSQRVEYSVPGCRGALIVYGSMHFSTQRLRHDWELLASLAVKELELRRTTQSLLEANDQMLALYELAKTSATSLGVETLLETLVAEASRLIECQSCMLLYKDTASQAVVGNVALRSELFALASTWQESSPERNAKIIRASETTLGVDVGLVSLVSGIETFGTLVVAEQPGQRIATPKRKLMDAVASHFGGLLSLSAMHETEVQTAILQRDVETAGLLADKLMPTWTPEVAGIEVAARSDCARLASGDFFTYAVTSYGLVAAVGDVSGKGLPAAIVMAMVSSATTAAAHRYDQPDPTEILQAVHEDVFAYLSEAGVFVTLVIATWDAEQQSLAVANAGHSPVLLASKGFVRAIAAQDPPLGVLDAIDSMPEIVPFEEGDVLFMGSDGLAEQENSDGKQLGYGKLESLVAGAAITSSEALVEDIFAEVERHGHGVAQDDDRTALVVKRKQEI